MNNVNEFRVFCRTHRNLSLVIAIGVSLCCGCGDLNSTSVRGTVAHDGTPIPSGTVVFESGNHTCIGRIKDGKYSLLCKGKPKIPLADYSVTVFPPQPEMKTNPKTLELEAVTTVDESLYPEKYRSRKSSPLKFTPVPGANDFAIELTD